jgi:hypothetical protein
MGSTGVGEKCLLIKAEIPSPWWVSALSLQAGAHLQISLALLTRFR